MFSGKNNISPPRNVSPGTYLKSEIPQIGGEKGQVVKESDHAATIAGYFEGEYPNSLLNALLNVKVSGKPHRKAT